MRYQWLAGGLAAAALSLSAPTPASAQSNLDTNTTDSAALSLSAPTPVSAHSILDINTTEVAALSLPAPTRASAQSIWDTNKTKAAALKWELAYLGLSALDAIQTIQCMEARKCIEANPLFGKRPKTETLILAKLIGGGVHFFLFNEVRKKNPKMALRVAQISVGLQGAVVGLNARVVF